MLPTKVPMALCSGAYAETDHRQLSGTMFVSRRAPECACERKYAVMDACTWRKPSTEKVVPGMSLWEGMPDAMSGTSRPGSHINRASQLLCCWTTSHPMRLCNEEGAARVHFVTLLLVTWVSAQRAHVLSCHYVLCYAVLCTV